MNRDEILRLARESGFTELEFYGSKAGANPTECLERFASLVVAYELRRLHEVEQELALWIEKTDWVQRTAEPSELGLHRADVLKSRIERAADAEAVHEREACAKVVESDPSYDWHPFACEAAYAIRKRGTNE